MPAVGFIYTQGKAIVLVRCACGSERLMHGYYLATAVCQCCAVCRLPYGFDRAACAAIQGAYVVGGDVAADALLGRADLGVPRLEAPMAWRPR